MIVPDGFVGEVLVTEQMTNLLGMWPAELDVDRYVAFPFILDFAFGDAAIELGIVVVSCCHEKRVFIHVANAQAFIRYLLAQCSDPEPGVWHCTGSHDQFYPTLSRPEALAFLARYTGFAAGPTRQEPEAKPKVPVV